MDEWLIRTADNIIVGPYEAEQVKLFIREKKLGEQDEICKANHYWFFLHEADELLKHLDLIYPKDSDPDDEDTETDTKVIEQTKTLIEDEPPIPDLPDLNDFEDEDTALRSRTILEYLSQVRKRAQQAQRAQVGVPETIGKIERPAVWKIIIFVLFALFGILVFTVLELISA